MAKSWCIRCSKCYQAHRFSLYLLRNRCVANRYSRHESKGVSFLAYCVLCIIVYRSTMVSKGCLYWLGLTRKQTAKNKGCIKTNDSAKLVSHSLRFQVSNSFPPRLQLNGCPVIVVKILLLNFQVSVLIILNIFDSNYTMPQRMASKTLRSDQDSNTLCFSRRRARNRQDSASWNTSNRRD